MDNAPSKNDGPENTVAEHAPALLLAAAGLTYAVGFLVVYRFYTRWGVNHVASDAFKAEYIHVGILALALPVAIGSMIIGFACYRSLESQQKAMIDGSNYKSSWISIFVLTNLVVVYYVLTILAPDSILLDSYVRAALFALPAIAIVGLATLYGLGRLLDRELQKRLDEAAEHKRESVKRDIEKLRVKSAAWLYRLKIVFLLISLAFDCYLLWKLKHIAYLILLYRWLPVTLFVFLSAIIGFYFFLILKMAPNLHNRVKFIVVSVAAAVCFPLAYFAVTAFAFGIFPFIPVTRGGANYIEVPQVRLVQATMDVPLSLQKVFDQPVWLIAESGDVLYVALDDESTTDHIRPPEHWLKPGVVPHIVTINRTLVAGWSSTPSAKSPDETNKASTP